MADTERIKTWGEEVLYYADLNAEFDNIIDDLNTVRDSIPIITTAAEGLLDDLSVSAMRTTLGVAYGTTSGTVCQGNDSRLSDTRTPTDNSVTQAKMADDSVGQAELKISLGEASTTDINGEAITLTGGLYCLFPQIKASAGNTVYWGQDNAGASTGAAAWSTSTSFATLINLSTSGGTGYAQWNYITASPPYDLGDGTVGGFIYLKLDKVTGSPVSVSIAQDPPWFGNVKASKDKLFGMDKIPHPFRNAGKRDAVIMIDPMSDLVRRLFERRAEGESISEIISGNKLKRGDKVTRHLPPGVEAYRYGWA